MRVLVHHIVSSLKWKLCLMFFSIILFIVVSIAIFSYMESSKSIKGDVERSSTQILKEANLNLERYFKEYEQFFMIVASSDVFRRWLQTESQSSRITSFTALKDNYFQSFATLHPEIMSITLLNRNGNENYYLREGGPALRYDYTMKNEVWLSGIGISTALNMFISRNSNYLKFNKDVVDLPVLTIVKGYEFTSDAQGYLKMDIALQPIQAILSELKTGDNGTGMIISRTGSVVAHTDPSRIGTPVADGLLTRIGENNSGSFYQKEGNQMITYRNIDKTDWKIIASVPYQDVARSIYRVKDVTILISVAGLLVSMALVILVSSSSTRNLKKLRTAMFKTGLDNLAVRVDIRGRDEVADLGRVYNKMLSNLENSIAELNQSRASQQEAVLTALQSQINSHFLYNALESIKFMAYVADQKEIVRTTLALSDMLRYVSNYRNAIVPLSQEIQYVNHYLHIMQTQYGDDLTYELTVVEDLKETLILKAIVQPIIENSIKYGLETTGTPLTIRISICRSADQYISVAVADNGPGFPEDVLRRMQAKLAVSNVSEQYKHLSNIGLLNVHYRLRMYYHDERCGVRVRNLEGASGSEVTLIMPAVWPAEGVHAHVQNIDR